eukprot:jgi/Tetstr1/462617/TSEL_007602.t1
MMPGPEWLILSYHVPGMSTFLPEVDHEDEARRKHETTRIMAAAKEMRHWNPEAHIGVDEYIFADVKAAVADATAGKTDEQEMRRGSQPTQTDVEQSGAGLGEPLATIHEDEHGQEEEEEEEEKEEEEEEGPITVGGVREWHNDYEMRRGIQQIKNKRFTKSTNTCQPCQGSSAPRTVLVDNRYYQVVAATR